MNRLYWTGVFVVVAVKGGAVLFWEGVKAVWEIEGKQEKPQDPIR